MPYIPNNSSEQEEMLQSVGAITIEELFNNIPLELRAKSFDLPSKRSEYETVSSLEKIASKNANDLVCFLGAGFYDHYVPAAVDAICSRSEFYTAYTPYQPECSQGSLQAIYEYQSVICRLTNMDVANASLYDGGTAIYEAILMALRINNKKKIIIDCGVNPIYRRMLGSYLKSFSIDFEEIPTLNGKMNKEAFLEAIDDTTSAIVFQNPNFFGVIDNYADIVKSAQNKNVLAIQSAYPIALGMLKTPGEIDVDIVVGEAQSLGMPLSFGGPYLGFLATKKKYMRKIPGRLVGLTVDRNNKPGFVLTLQAREQHIRREKATSNICSNQALCALRALVYLCLIGRQGIKDIAQLCFQKSEYLKTKLLALDRVTLTFNQPTFNEFVVTLPRNPNQVIADMMGKSILAGVNIKSLDENFDNELLISVTEKRTREDLDAFVQTLEEIL